MVRGGGGDIPGNDPGQGSTSPSTFTHVLGVSGAPIGAVGGAADGRRNMTDGFHQARTGNGMMLPVERHTQCMPLSVPFNKEHHAMAGS